MADISGRLAEKQNAQKTGFSAKGDLQSHGAEAQKCEKAKSWAVRRGEDMWKVPGR